jgi:hypothetical protein
MNLDELKTEWKQFDQKVQSTQRINEKIIVSMITERSSERFLKVRRNYLFGLAWMLVCLLFGIAILAGNPFDYEFTIQYVPTAIFCVCLLILISALFKLYLDLQKVDITHSTVELSLKKIIAVYERPQQFLKYTVIVFLFTQVFLFPLSFLPRSIERLGLWFALAERLLPISIAALMLFIAHKLGAFKEPHKKKFMNDLSELHELKAMVSELRNDK